MEHNELLDSFRRLEARVDDLSLRTPPAPAHRLATAPLVEGVLAALLLLPLGGFLGDHLAVWRRAPLLALPAVALFVFTVAVLASAIRQQVLIRAIDLAAPVRETQARLAELRLLRIRSTQSAIVGGLVGWVAGPLWVLQLVGGPGAVANVEPAWIAANLAFGAALAPLVVWAVRRSRWANSIQDEIAGRDVLEAESFLRELREFGAR